MTPILLLSVFLVLLLSGPTMIGARLVGAGRNGFFFCLTATIMAVIASMIVQRFLPNRLILASIIQLACCAAIFEVMLDTSFLKGAIIAILLLVIQFLCILALAGIGYAYLR